jgi:hypothetical protein
MKVNINKLLNYFLKLKEVKLHFAHKNFPDWRLLLKKGINKKKRSLFIKTRKPKVLIATSIGGDAPSTTIESLIAVALSLRGASPTALLCDSALPACLRGNVNNYPSVKEFEQIGPKDRYCKGCFENSEKSFSSAGIQVLKYSELISKENRKLAATLSSSTPYEKIANFELDGIALGEHALAGTLRFFARGTLDGEIGAEVVLRRFFEASILTSFALNALFQKEKYDSALFSHGIYIPLGIVGEVARKNGVRVVNWVTAYRKQRFIFSHGDSYHHTMISEPKECWDSIDWNKKLDDRLMKYLISRVEGTRDWIWFHEKPEEEMVKIASDLGLNLNKPAIGLLTNVVWDAQLHFKANAFDSMLDWIIKTIEYFSKRRDLQLVIRVHPAEIRGTVKSRQRVIEELLKYFKELPSNVFLIPPESPISTYAVMDVCDSVIIYGTKTGVELAARGMPVIVAGEAWVRNKGFTFDASSPGQYFRILDGLPLRKKLDEVSTVMAKKYAYHFFFRRMIPLPMVLPCDDPPPFKIQLNNDVDDLMPGVSLGLDVVCDGVLEGKPFIYRDELDYESQID